MTENKENENNLGEILTDAAEETADLDNIPEQSEKNLKGNYKTLQQLSLEYGITRQGMKARLDKMLAEVSAKGLNESDYVGRGKRNTVYVLEPGLIWLARFDAENSPMRPPAQNIDLELQKLKNTEEINEQLKSEIEILKEQLKYLQQDLKSKDEQLTAKDNQITGLTATVAQQSKTLDTQLNQILALTAPKEDPGTSEAPKNEPGAAETSVSTSEDELRAELSKKSFWGKMKLLFS